METIKGTVVDIFGNILDINRAPIRIGVGDLSLKPSEKNNSNQSHFAAQLEMLNPQRTLERGYAVILNNQKQAARNPKQLNTGASFEIRLAEGQAQVQFSEVLQGQ